MNTEKITVQANIAQSPSNVWDYYTKPEHITKWNFASDEWQCPTASNDLRKGGQYYARMEAKDGSWGFDFEAIYNNVITGQTFTYTMSDGRQATTTFQRVGDNTEVTTTFDAENTNPLEMQKAGWQAILDNFKKYAQSNK